MVSIGKLGKGQETYYLDSVAGGADDYYSGEGEAPGRWTGSGASELGLEGTVEREAAFTRLGTDGHTAARGSGFVAAAFRHRMSRAGDAQLHTHVLVANLIKTPDGKWRTLDGQRLYRRAKTAGYLYQAHLRAELARELGVSWREVHRGAAEIAGVADETLRAFSRRRREIEARMAERGGTSRRSAEIAALETRRRKDYGVRPM